MPTSIESENAVIGAIFKNPKYMDEIAEVLKPEHFYNIRNQKVFGTMLDLYKNGKNIDFLTVKNNINDKNITPDFLVAYVNTVAAPANCIDYADIVIEKAQKREYIETSYKIVSMMQNDSNEENVFDKSQYMFMELADKVVKDDLISSAEGMGAISQKLIRQKNGEDLIEGISSGYADLDEIFSKFRNKDYYILAARPSMGKTALSLNFLLRAAKNNIPGLFFSFEMGFEKLSLRLLCAEAKVDQSKFTKNKLTEDEREKLLQTSEYLKSLNFHIDESAITELDIRAKARKAKNKYDIQFIVVDYIQLIKCSERKNTRDQEVSHVSAALARLAKELNVPVIALAQLNRKLEERSDKRPVLSDLRESGSLEQDADGIMFLYRDEVYNPSDDNPLVNHAELIVRKNRDGPTGVVDLTFLKEYGVFENHIPDLDS